jgi:hypothetical protein
MGGPNASPLGLGLPGIILGEGGCDEGGDDAPAAPAAWAKALRLKLTRQRCQVAVKILETAALIPSWASDTTSFTPRPPRRTSFRRKLVQKVSASEGPISTPSTSRRPSALTPMATMTATEMTRPA